MWYMASVGLLFAVMYEPSMYNKLYDRLFASMNIDWNNSLIILVLIVAIKMWKNESILGSRVN